MDFEVPLSLSAILADIVWRRALRERGWTAARIRTLERRMNLIGLAALSLGLIGITVLLS